MEMTLILMELEKIRSLLAIFVAVSGTSLVVTLLVAGVCIGHRVEKWLNEIIHEDGDT